MMRPSSPKEQKQKIRARPSTNLLFLGTTAIALPSLSFLISLIPPLSTTQGHPVNFHLTEPLTLHSTPADPSNTTLLVTTEHLGIPSLIFLTIAHTLLLITLYAATLLTTTSIEQALSSEHPTAFALKRVTAALWALPLGLLAYSGAIWMANSTLPPDLPQIALSSSLTMQFWGPLALMGILWTVRRTILWGLQRERDVEGLV